MGRSVRAIIAVILVGVIAFSAISICQNSGKGLKLDITEQRLYTLSDGTRAIVGKLNQPLKMRLYYTRTAARKGPDQIRFYNNYYYFVQTLLEEYADAAKGMINLEVIDPRPFSDEEEEALRYGLRRFPITEEENFFFGLVLQTQFGVVKTIPFFSPNRQSFVEYDISHLIDTAVTRQKKRIGILSSLAVMGDDVTGYMARMMQMQGKRPKPAWGFVDHLRQQYEVSKVETNTADINDVDILLVIHPKKLEEKTQFAIDQFVLKGGRAIVCVDPRCFMDNPQRPPGQMMGGDDPSSNLSQLMQTWGVEMGDGEFAGDRELAMLAQVEQNQGLKKLIGYLNLGRDSVNTESVITANLNQVRVFFAGGLRKAATTGENGVASENEIVPLLQTTNRGNLWRVEGPWDWIRIVPEKFMRYFQDGTEPVVISYLVKGKFKSAFPGGIVLPAEPSEGKDGAEGPRPEKGPKRLTGLEEASTGCAVVVISDVDFISDMVAYTDTMFGMKMPVGNNSDLLLNAIDELSGSNELIGVRSRGNFQRPFVVVDEIRAEAEKATAEEIASKNADIAVLQQELDAIVASAKKGDEGIIAASIMAKRREAELKVHKAKAELRDVDRQRFEKIEQLGSMLRNVNVLAAPGAILLAAIVLSMRRRLLRRRYVSHASDA